MQVSYLLVPEKTTEEEKIGLKSSCKFSLSVKKNGIEVHFPRGITLTGKNLKLSLQIGSSAIWSDKDGKVNCTIASWGWHQPNLSQEYLQILKEELPQVLKQLEAHFGEEPAVDILSGLPCQTKLTIEYRFVDPVYQTDLVTTTTEGRLWFSCPAPHDQVIQVGQLMWDPKLRSPVMGTVSGKDCWVFNRMGWLPYPKELNLSEEALEDAFRQLGAKLIEQCDFELKTWTVKTVKTISLE